MDSEIISVKQSSHNENESYQIKTTSKSSNKNCRSGETDIFEKEKKRLCSYIHSSNMRILIFILFIMIVIIIAILTISLTAPKSSELCEMTFKRMNQSSLIDSSQPRFIAIEDLNKDNKMDIVVANIGTNTIGIFISNDDQTFGKEQIYSTGSGSRPSSIVINDFNNDNNMDIAVANSGTNNIGIFIGYQNGTFQNQKVFSTGSYRPWFITIADFNKDNQPDIAVVYYATDNIGIILGNANGSFQSPIAYSTGYDSFPYSLVVADFNKDNKLDIAVANYGTDNIQIFFGYSNGTFSSETTYTTSHNSSPSSIALGDFNNDYKLDIVVANYGNGNIAI